MNRQAACLHDLKNQTRCLRSLPGLLRIKQAPFFNSILNFLIVKQAAWTRVPFSGPCREVKSHCFMLAGKWLFVMIIFVSWSRTVELDNFITAGLRESAPLSLNLLRLSGGCGKSGRKQVSHNVASKIWPNEQSENTDAFRMDPELDHAGRNLSSRHFRSSQTLFFD